MFSFSRSNAETGGVRFLETKVAQFEFQGTENLNRKFKNSSVREFLFEGSRRKSSQIEFQGT